MITINKTVNSINLDVPLDGVYGFVTDGAVCFISNNNDYMTTVWDMVGIKVDDIRPCKTIGQVIEWTKFCRPEDVLKVLYTQGDFDIVVDV